MKKKTFIKRILIIFLATIYYFFLYNIFLECSFNSDSANFILEANDIIHGNVLLNGWNLTGISFIATDLLLYVFASLFVGINPLNAVIAGALGYFLLIIVCVLVLHDQKIKSQNFINLLLFIAIAGIPATFLIEYGRYHTVCIAEVLLGLYLWNKLEYTSRSFKEILYIVTSTLLFSFAVMSDALSLLLLLFPAMMVSIWTIIIDYARNESINFQKSKQLSVVFFSIVLGFLFDKIYFGLSTANKNSFLASKKFIPLENYGEKLIIFVRTILRLFNADFPGQMLFSINTLFYFLRTLIILVGIICIIYNITQLLRAKPANTIATILSIGIILTSLVFIITDIATAEESGRYIATFPALFIIIILKTVIYWQIKYNNLRSIKLSKIAIGIVSITLIVGSYQVLYPNKLNQLEPQTKLVTVLDNLNLTNGFSSFWNASSTTVISHNRIKVRAVTFSNNHIHKFNWFCKDKWYKTPANFIVVDSKDMFGITYDNVASILGTPVQTVDVENYQILIYDQNISEYVFNGLDDNILLPAEWFGNEQATIIDGQYMLSPGGMLFGPYIPMGKGIYTFSCSGENVENAYVDVYSLTNGTIMAAEEIGADKSFTFTLQNDTSDIEIRVYNNTSDQIKITSFKIN